MWKIIKCILKKSIIKALSLLPNSFPNLFIVKGVLTIKEVILKQNTNWPPVFITKIHSQQKIHREHPLTVDGNIHWKFKENAIGIAEQSASTFFTTLYNAKVFGENGVAFTNDNFLIEELSPELSKPPSEHSLLNSIKYKRIKKVKGVSFLLTGTDAAENYFHWMTDALPKIKIVSQGQVKINDLDFFIINNLSCPFQKDTFIKLGIPFSKLISLKKHEYLQCEKLLVTSPTCLSGNVPLWIVNFLRDIYSSWMVNDVRYNGSKIYISRKYAKKRRLLNENELWDRLSVLGFKKYFLEELNIEDQIKLFFNAAEIIGVHGAGFTNLAFSKPGTKVLEIFPPSYVNQCYWTIASHSKLSYYYIIGDGPDVTTTANHLIESDFTLTTSQIMKIELFYNKIVR